MENPTPDELIARLQAATEPDRKLDIAIQVALFGYQSTWCGCTGQCKWPPFICPSAPAYTLSLDAAVRLVPEDWNWSIWHEDGLIHAKVFRFDGARDVEFENGPDESDAETTPAIALCIPAIRARVFSLAGVAP